jgi:hypothetical protein
LGHGPRHVQVRVRSIGSGRITIGVSRNHNHDPTQTVAEIVERIEQTSGDTDLELTIYCGPDWSYSIYGRSLGGLRLDDVVVRLSGLQDRFIEAQPLDPNAIEGNGWISAALEQQLDSWMMHCTPLGYGARRIRVRIKTNKPGSITIGVNRFPKDNAAHIAVDALEDR